MIARCRKGSPVNTDIIATLTGPAALPVVAHRADLMEATLRNERAVIAPDDPGGLSHAQRRALACRIAELNGDPALATHYAPGASPGGNDTRWTAILRHIDLVTQRPRDATRDDIAALLAAGVAEADIVRLSQLIGFVNYQVRVIAGLRLIASAA
jgi:uncharacterized protein YciW